MGPIPEPTTETDRKHPDTAVDTEVDPFGEVYEGEWQYTSTAAPGDTPTVADLRNEGEGPNARAKVGHRAGEIFQQGVTNLLDTLTERGSKAAADFGITTTSTGKDTVQVQERNAARAQTLTRLKAEGWQVVQSKPGSIADMAGYDIIMVDSKGSWFPIDTTLNAGEKKDNGLLVHSTRRPFNRKSDGTVELSDPTFAAELVDQVGKIMKNVGGPDGKGFPSLEDLRPPDLNTEKLTHQEVLDKLKEYKEKLSQFDGGGNALTELEKRIDRSIKHRFNLVAEEKAARDTIMRNLDKVTDGFIRDFRDGKTPSAKEAKSFDVGNGKQHVQLTADGQLVITREADGERREWNAESRTELNAGELSEAVEKMIREKAANPAEAQKIIDHLQANPDARKHIFNELGKEMVGVTDITGKILADKTDNSRRKPLDPAQKAEIKIGDPALSDFFKDLAGDHANRKGGSDNGWDHMETNQLLKELKVQRAKLSGKQSELTTMDALHADNLKEKAARESKRQSPSRDVLDEIRDYPQTRKRVADEIEGKGKLKDAVEAIETELTKRTKDAFAKVLKAEQLAGLGIEAQESMAKVREAMLEKMKVTVGEKSETVFRDKSDQGGKEYRLADLALDGRVVQGADGPTGLKMKDGKEIPFDQLTVEVRLDTSTMDSGKNQRELLRQLVELDHSLSLDARRDGGTANTTPAEEQLRRDKEHIDRKLDKRLTNAQEAGERQAIRDALRQAIGDTDLRAEKELVVPELRDLLDKLEHRVSESLHKELKADVDNYEKGDADATERLKKQLAEPKPEATERPAPVAAPAPVADASGAVRESFNKLSNRLQNKLPTEFNADVKSVLEQMLEAKRNEPFADELRKLVTDYGNENPAAIKRVNELLADGKTAKEAAPTAAVASTTKPPTAEGGDLKRPQQHTPELADKPAAVKLAMETFATADGIRFIKSIPIAELSAAKVHEKLKDIDSEIQKARESGLHEYAEELKRMKTEYEGKKTQGEKDTYAKEVVERMKEAHESASHAGKPGKGPGIAGKAGTTVAVLLIAGWLMDVTAPKAVASPSGPRVLPGKR